MTTPTADPDLLGIFAQELGELAEAVQRDALALERADESAQAGLVDALFRSLHTAKGAAAGMGFKDFAERAHALESRLSAVKSGSGAADEDLVERLLGWVEDAEALCADLHDDEDAGADASPAPSAENERRAPSAMSASAEELRIHTAELRVAVRGVRDLSVMIEDLVTVLQDDAGRGERGAADRIAAAREAASTARSLERRLHHTTDALDARVRTLRLRTVQEVYGAVEREVRRVASESGREVALDFKGGDVRVDRDVLQAVQPALLHLVRNAVVHGIEPPDERERCGKPTAGAVQVHCRSLDSEIEITVRDDGRGVDMDRMRRAAEEAGLEPPEDLAAAGAIIFEPGFTTADDVSDVSGRGVGLDAVRGTASELGGRLAARVTEGDGCEVSLTVPISLSVARVLVVAAGGALWSLPTSVVLRVIHFGRRALTMVDGGPHWHDNEHGLVPVADAAGALVPDADPAAGPGLLIRAADNHVVLRVDAVHDDVEVVVREPGPLLRGVPMLAGAARLASGAPVAVVEPAALLRRAAMAVPAGTERGAEDAGPPRVLVVDDSFTTRTMQAGLLRSAGFDVDVAENGAVAWDLLRRDGADLVVTDIDMPVMGGLELTRRIRATDAVAAMPIVVVSSAGSDEEIMAGMDAGADAYVVKSTYDPTNVVSTVRELLQ